MKISGLLCLKNGIMHDPESILLNIKTGLNWFSSAHDAGDGSNPRAIVRSDGLVTLIKPAILQSSCQINVKYFPLDEQVGIRASFPAGSFLFRKKDPGWAWSRGTQILCGNK